MNNMQQRFVLVPSAQLEAMAAELKEIRQLLSGGAAPAGKSLGDYVSEAEAATLLGKKPGWLWQQRVKGMLPYLKMGRKVFYKRSDLTDMLERTRKSSFRT